MASIFFHLLEVPGVLGTLGSTRVLAGGTWNTQGIGVAGVLTLTWREVEPLVVPHRFTPRDKELGINILEAPPPPRSSNEGLQVHWDIDHGMVQSRVWKH